MKNLIRLIYRGLCSEYADKSIAKSLLELLSTVNIDRIARLTGFVKLKSVLDGSKFLKLLFYNSEQDKNLSLNQLSLKIFDKNGKTLTKQAINSRFSAKSVDFIKSIFETYLQKICISFQTDQTGNKTWMDLFNRVLVKDGTRFDLPAIFAKFFKGFGGKCTSDSAVCLQFEYDLKAGKIVELKATSANIPDSKDAQLTKDSIQKGDLILRDLGYFGLNIFEEIISKGAYFISKLNTQVVVFELINDQFRVLDFKNLHQIMKNSDSKTIELEVYIGKSKKIPVRLIIELIPEQVYEQRMRAKKKESKKKGHTMREECAARQHFNCYITNIEKEKLPAPAIRNIYRMRWQIELVFKQWKSTYHIHTTHQMKFERWMTLFYARMLLMLIHWQIYHSAKSAKYKRENTILSLSKCLQSLRLASDKITALIGQGYAKFKTTIDQLIQTIATKHDLEKKKGRKNQQQIMDIIYCISDN